MHAAGCPLCDGPGGVLVHQGEHFRVVRADEEGFPAFWRLVWNEHVAEFSDLPAAERHACMEGVAAVERAVREVLQPAKVNLASLGNMVAHLHWHVIARYPWDSRFPSPVWAPAVRQPQPPLLDALALRCAEADAAIVHALRS